MEFDTETVQMMGGPPKPVTVYKGHIRPIHDRVIVRQMHFGEMVTKSGLILGSDDGKEHGIKPRWGKVYAKGHENKDEFNVGEAQPIRPGHPEDPDWDWDWAQTTVDDAITDLTELEAFATKKTTKQLHKKKRTTKKDVNPEIDYDDTYDLDYDID